MARLLFNELEQSKLISNIDVSDIRKLEEIVTEVKADAKTSWI